MHAHLSARVSMSTAEEGAFGNYVIRPVMPTWVCNALDVRVGYVTSHVLSCLSASCRIWFRLCVSVILTMVLAFVLTLTLIVSETQRNVVRPYLESDSGTPTRTTRFSS
jgi:hypothetical protein